MLRRRTFRPARRWSLLVAVALPPAIFACTSSDVSTSESEVTSVESTPVKSQAIGNCWLYATAGWAESLHKGTSGRDVDLSEAYWNYWYWYEQITHGDLALYETGVSKKGTVSQGAWWGVGAELIHRYGWMYETDFIADDDAKATRHRDAVGYIDNALRGGALATPESRNNPALVRAELDRAWRLSSAVVEELRTTFPVAAVPETGSYPATTPALTDRPSADLPRSDIHRPQDLPVLAADGVHRVSLADVVGTVKPGTKYADGQRVGAEAWNEIRYTWQSGGADDTRRLAMLRNVQSVLNRRLAVPVAWALARRAQGGVYRGNDLRPEDSTGIHESILVDYEVENVPGFGTLRVDERETRPAALEATLDERATVTFFRLKNSWGVDPTWTEEELRQAGISPDSPSAQKPNYLPSKPGFNDIYLDYLDATYKEVNVHYGMRFALPPSLPFDVPASVAPVDGGAEGGADGGGAGSRK